MVSEDEGASHVATKAARHVTLQRRLSASLASIILLACTPVQVLAQDTWGAPSTAAIGGANITLPMPPGFQDPQAAAPALRRQLVKLHELPGTRLLAAGVSQADVKAVLAERDPALDFYYVVMAIKPMETVSVTPEFFSILKAQARSQRATLAERSRAAAQAHTNAAARDVMKESGRESSVEVKIARAGPIGELLEGPDWVLFSVLAVGDVVLNGQKQSVQQVNTTLLVRVRDRMISFVAYRLYRDQADVEAAHRFALQWQEKLRTTN